MLYGTKKRKKNENLSSIEDLYSEKDFDIISKLKIEIKNYISNQNEDFKKLKNLIDSSNIYQIYTSTERFLIDLYSIPEEEINENQWEKYFFILEYIGDYISLIEILKLKIENSDHFSSFFMSILISLKDVLISLNLVNEITYLIVKKCSNSSNEHHRLIEDFIRRLNSEYPKLIDFEKLQKEFSGLSLFLQGIKAPISSRRILNTVDKELSENIKKIIGKIENLNDLEKIIENLKEIKNSKRNTDPILIFEYSIKKFISLIKNDERLAILYVILIRELYSSGFLTMLDISDAISNFIQSNFNKLDSINFTKFLFVCVSKGIISSENLIENILENTFKNLNHLLKNSNLSTSTASSSSSTNDISSFDKHVNFIEILLLEKKSKEKLNYNGKFIPKIVKKIVQFLDQKDLIPEDISGKIIKVLEDIFFEKQIFEKIACQPEILKNCLKELENLPENQKEKCFLKFIYSLYTRSNLNEIPTIESFQLIDFIKYLTKNSTVWNFWLNSFTFEKIYSKENLFQEEILSRLMKPIFDIRSKNEENLISYSHLISNQKLIKEKLLIELKKLISNYSISNLIKIKNIIYSLLHSKTEKIILEKICQTIAIEFNNILIYSKVHTMFKNSIEFEENKKKLEELLIIFNDLTLNLKSISSFYDPFRNLLFCKLTNYKSIQNLLYKIFIQNFDKLDNEKRNELKKIILNENGSKRGWDCIEEYTSYCQNCHSTHGKVTCYQYTPTTITKRKSLFFESENKKKKVE